MNDNLALIRFIMAENADLGLVSSKALELAKALGLDFDMGDDGVCIPVPWTRVFIDNF